MANIRKNKIAIIQIGERHTEVLGGLIETVGRKGREINVYSSKYESTFVPYFSKLFKKEHPTWNVNFFYRKNFNNIPEHDLYIFSTGADDYDYQTPPEKTLLLIHTTEDKNLEKEVDCLGLISISPIFRKHKIPFFLNVFSAPISRKENNSKITITIVGLTNPDNKDIPGVKKFLDYLSQHDDEDEEDNYDVQVNVINYYSVPEFKKYEKYSFYKSFVDVSVSKMIQLLRKTDYIATIANKNSSYHNKQLSGIIPLAISFGIPMIIDQKLADIYDLTREECEIYSHDKQLKDVFLKTISHFEEKKYRNQRRNLLLLRDEISKENRQKFNNLDF